MTVRGSDPLGPRMASQFAARLARRHTRRAIGRRVSLPLAISARLAPSSVVHRHLRFGDMLQTRLAIKVHLHRTLITAATAASRQALDRSTAPPRDARAGVAAGAPRHLVSIGERLPLRARRLEAAPPLRSAGAAARHIRADAAAAPPAPRTVAPLTLVRRHEPAARSTESARAAAHVDRGAVDLARNPHTTRMAQSRRADTAIVPDGEIERLADRVITSIDRRIAAQSERLGRF